MARAPQDRYLAYRDDQPSNMDPIIIISDPQDIMSQLPIELLHNILSFLVAPYSGLPRITGLNHLALDREMLRMESSGKKDAVDHHPFLNLAATSSHLRDVVENFCWHLLKRHQDVGTWSKKIGDNEPMVRDGKKEKRLKGKKTTYRMIWLKWAKRRCVFCGKVSQRRAIFNNLIYCCSKCDRIVWPGKITKTAATKAPYFLTDFDLFLPNEVVPWTPGLWRIKHATYDCIGVHTTMFLLDEITALAQAVHGDNIGSDVDVWPEGVKEARKKNQSKKMKEGRKYALVFSGGRWYTRQMATV